MTVVTASDTAVAAAQQMNRILTGDLQSQLGQLNSQAQILADPMLFQGAHAAEFQSFWHGTAAPNLEATRADLADLTVRLQAVINGILAAGGPT
jgi:hypothetical protein